MLKLSVIVPVYKAEQYLKRCIDSILGQNYKNIELILVDDGSPDACPGICDQYQEKDERVIVFHQQNSGVAVARNSGMRIATGDYITFVDSDDYIGKEMYSSMLKKIEQYQCDVAMCDCIKEFRTHTELYTHDIRGGYYSRKQLEEEYYPHLLMMENVEYPATISNWLLVFKNEKKENTGNALYTAAGGRTEPGEIQKPLPQRVSQYRVHTDYSGGCFNPGGHLMAPGFADLR